MNTPRYFIFIYLFINIKYVFNIDCLPAPNQNCRNEQQSKYWVTYLEIHIQSIDPDKINTFKFSKNICIKPNVCTLNSLPE